jgi:alpha-beta hydrolase superfamily lysophospholipase
MRCDAMHWLLLVLALAGPARAGFARKVEVPIGKAGEVQVAEIVSRLARASEIEIRRPTASVTLSTVGLARALTRTLLSEALGPEVEIAFQPGVMVLTLEDRILAPERRADWAKRLNELADRATEAAKRRELFGMRALRSYRPNDPARPTVCLVHGMNSSSGGFVHMIPWLEQAGYGIVIYDYAFNQPIADSCTGFARDWAAMRRQLKETLPWSIVAHSMGALLARSLVEDDTSWAGDVSSMILIAPVNQGSHLARVQTIIQLLSGLQSINDKKTSRAMLTLADGLGEAAWDLLPQSAFLNQLNRRPRRNGVPYHILAGDGGFLTRDARAQVHAQLDLAIRGSGVLGRLAKAATADLPDLLDELTDGTGDGCVAVVRTRLEGVADHRTIHANHAELIRAPLLFPDPGPVACIPQVLEWLSVDRQRHR